MSDEGVVYLEINSWVGISLGATHTYGELVSEVDGERKAVKVSKPRSAADCNADNGDMVRRYGKNFKDFYEPGSLTTSFVSEAAVIARAKKIWREHFPEGWLLVKGHHSTADPQPILVGPAALKDKVNELVAKAEAVNWYGGNEDERREMEAIYNRFVMVMKRAQKARAQGENVAAVRRR